MLLQREAKQLTPQTRSARCHAEDFWDNKQQKCMRCAKQYAHYLPLIGHEFNVNCGHRDGGGRNVPPTRPCPAGTANDGSFLWCQPSREAPRDIVRITQSSPQPHTEAPSHPTSVSILQGSHSTVGIAWSSLQPHTEAPSRPTPDAFQGRTLSESPGGATVPLVLILLLVALVGVALVVLLLLLAAWRNRKSAPGLGTGLELVAEVEAEPEPEVELPAGLRVLPLQVLLDDADVLQALAELLDPAGTGGTRALAGRYGLSAAWAEHAYWLRSTRSPLRATLQAVAARRPHATLGGLAWRLAAMGRRDALQVLAGLQVPPAEPGPTPPSSPQGDPGVWAGRGPCLMPWRQENPATQGPVCSHSLAGGGGNPEVRVPSPTSALISHSPLLCQRTQVSGLPLPLTPIPTPLLQMQRTQPTPPSSPSPGSSQKTKGYGPPLPSPERIQAAEHVEVGGQRHLAGSPLPTRGQGQDT